jgi:hypothetical protein
LRKDDTLTADQRRKVEQKFGEVVDAIVAASIV